VTGQGTSEPGHASTPCHDPPTARGEHTRHFGCAPQVTVRAVDATKNPAYLRDLAADVDKFRDEFVSFLELCVFTPMTLAPGLLPPVTPREDVADEAYSEAKERVSRAAGRIAHLPGPARMRIAVAGAGEFDVIDAWLTVTQPKPLFYPDDVLAVCNNVIGRLEGMIKRAEAEEPFQVDVEAMNPLIWGAARKLWNDEHHREAVLAASGALVHHVKQLTGMIEVDETNVWQLAFSNADPQPGRPRLRWPGDPKDQTVRSMNEGLRLYGPALQLAIRNPLTHDLTEITAQQGAERLSALSLLAQWVEASDLVHAKDAGQVDEPSN
jgi:hypothetical protein